LPPVGRGHWEAGEERSARPCSGSAQGGSFQWNLAGWRRSRWGFLSGAAVVGFHVCLASPTGSCSAAWSTRAGYDGARWGHWQQAAPPRAFSSPRPEASTHSKGVTADQASVASAFLPPPRAPLAGAAVPHGSQTGLSFVAGVWWAARMLRIRGRARFGGLAVKRGQRPGPGLRLMRRWLMVLVPAAPKLPFLRR